MENLITTYKARAAIKSLERIVCECQQNCTQDYLWNPIKTYNIIYSEPLLFLFFLFFLHVSHAFYRPYYIGFGGGVRGEQKNVSQLLEIYRYHSQSTLDLENFKNRYFEFVCFGNVFWQLLLLDCAWKEKLTKIFIFSRHFEWRRRRRWFCFHNQQSSCKLARWIIVNRLPCVESKG